MNHLELFSGTHSFGKVSSKQGFNVYSLDRDLGAECKLGSGYTSKIHFQEDIFTWDYKQFDKGFFKLITASPVCLWWSALRTTWIGRKMKGMDRPFTKEDIESDIERYGKPMVDKVFEIIDYFEPDYFIIENPATGKMKHYINELVPYYDVDYCKYSDWGYKKTTRFWTNIEGLNFDRCKNDCDNMIVSGKQKLHKSRMGTSFTVIDNGKIIRVNSAELRKKYKDFKDVSKDYGSGNTRLQRYRIPEKIIEMFVNKILS